MRNSSEFFWSVLQMEEDLENAENPLKHKHLKRRMKQFKKEYETLKVRVGYQSSSDDDSNN